MQAEENALRAGRTRVMDGSGGLPSWNHAEFHVQYPSLARQLSVSGIYVKLLLDGLDQVLPLDNSSDDRENIHFPLQDLGVALKECVDSKDATP